MVEKNDGRCMIKAQFVSLGPKISAIILTHPEAESRENNRWADFYEEFFDACFAKSFTGFLESKGLDPTKPMYFPDDMESEIE